jgi:hypothetical protein
MYDYIGASLNDSVNKLILSSLMAEAADQMMMIIITQIKGDLDEHVAHINTQIVTLQKEINDLYEVQLSM